MVFVDNRDRGIAHFLRTALGLRDNGEGEAVDDEAQQHVIAHKAAQLLGAKPEDVAEGRHRASLSLSFLLAHSSRLSASKPGMNSISATIFVARSGKPRPLVKVPTPTGR
ncbi:MAG TPA: hypothetical protein VL985_08555 [Stellaceae bacterium]|nr:hypothetical protein [Stellaceae bacterium]